MPLAAGSLGFTVLLGALIALTSLGIDSYVPALPGLAASFDASVGSVQLTLTSFFAGLAIGQLIWGPLSDRYGRKPSCSSGSPCSSARRSPAQPRIRSAKSSGCGSHRGLACPPDR